MKENSSRLKVLYQLVAHSCWGKDTNVSKQGTDVLRRRIVNSYVGNIRFVALVQVLVKQVKDVLLLQWESLYELQRFCENVEWLVVRFRAKCYRESTYFVDDSSVFKDSLGANKHAVNLRNA